MTPLESMRLRMAETGLYTFSGQTAGTALDWELEAYAAGLEPFYKQVKGFLENSFPETAREEALSLWESLLGVCCVFPLFREARAAFSGRQKQWEFPYPLRRSREESAA